MTPSVDPPLRIALWCAVSSRPQAERSSLHDQEQAGRDFAAAVGGHVVAVYTVPGHTRDLVFWPDDVPAYASLRADLEPALGKPDLRPWDVLHAIDVDRLGRDPALSNQVISLVERAGAEVYLASAPHPIGQSSTGLRYVHAIQSVRAKETQDRRVQGQRDGLSARLRSGLPASHWPTGYTPIRDQSGKVTGARLDDNAPAIRLITDLFLKGEPYTEIRRRLEASPYPAPNASSWNYGAIYYILHNDTYAGYPHWGDVQPDRPSDKYPALWDPATFSAVRRERARRAPNRAQRSTGSPIAAICYCARCGSRMHRWTGAGGRRPRLRCATHANRSVRGVDCHPNSILEATVVSRLADHLAALAADPAALSRALATPGLPSVESAADLQRRLDLVEGKRRRLAHALAAGKMDLDLYHATDVELKAQAAVLEDKTKSLQELLEATPTVEERRAAILALAKMFADLVATAPPQRVRVLLQNAGLRVELEAGAITQITP